MIGFLKEKVMIYIWQFLYHIQRQCFGGDIEVTFTVKKGIVNDLDISGPKETTEIGGKAINKIKKSMQKSGKFEVDNVSGASVTSKGIKDAINNAKAQ